MQALNGMHHWLELLQQNMGVAMAKCQQGRTSTVLMSEESTMTKALLHPMILANTMANTVCPTHLGRTAR